MILSRRRGKMLTVLTQTETIKLSELNARARRTHRDGLVEEMAVINSGSHYAHHKKGVMPNKVRSQSTLSSDKEWKVRRN